MLVSCAQDVKFYCIMSGSLFASKISESKFYLFAVNESEAFFKATYTSFIFLSAMPLLF